MTTVLPDTLRTPDERFENLPGYPFTPHYVSDLPGYEGLRMHYLDEGPADAPHVFLCVHGEPTWSYLFRSMIPVFAAAGHRVIAPDMFGFGRSDKPATDETYTFDFHRESLLRLIDHLDLRGVTLVCQDWGGVLGLTLPVDRPDRFEGLLVMNTGLGTGDAPLGPGFSAWRDYNNANPDLDIATLMRRSCRDLPRDVANAYAAPYPDVRYKGGVRRFPNLVPDAPDAPGTDVSRRARDYWTNDWNGRTFMAVGMKDPVIGPRGMRHLRRVIRNCPEPLELQDAGHFVQEDAGEEVARAALRAWDMD